MSGSGKRADQKKTWIIKKFGNNYFGKRRKKMEKKKVRMKKINLKDIKLRKNKEINLKGYKVLGVGEVKAKLIIKADRFSKKAKEKIEKAGGQVISRAESEKMAGRVRKKEVVNLKKEDKKKIKKDN